MEQFPYDPPELPIETGEIPDEELLEPDEKNVVEMVRMAREVIGGYGHEPIIIPGPAESPNQLLCFIHCDRTQAVLWFEHLEEVEPFEHAVTHGIVNEDGEFLVYELPTLLASVDHDGNDITQETVLELAGLNTALINGSYLGFRREELFHPASPEEFTRFHGYIAQLRSDLYL